MKKESRVYANSIRQQIYAPREEVVGLNSETGKLRHRGHRSDSLPTSREEIEVEVIAVLVGEPVFSLLN